MTNFKPVQDALASGADPSMLCTTCPWDRNCVTSPTMTSAEVDARIKQASAEDEVRMAAARAAGEQAMPTGTLLMTLAIGSQATTAQVCPVFAMRLRSGAGRQIADSIRSSMQGWDDAS